MEETMLDGHVDLCIVSRTEKKRLGTKIPKWLILFFFLDTTSFGETEKVFSRRKGKKYILMLCFVSYICFFKLWETETNKKLLIRLVVIM